MIRPFTRRLLTHVGLALLEATPPAVLLTLWGVPGAWGVLVLTVLAAGGIDWLLRTFMPERYQRPAVAVVALLLSLAVAASCVPDRDLALSLFSLTSGHNLISYAGLLAGLYASMRGVRLYSYESVGLRELFMRIMGLTLLALLVGGAGNRAEAPLLLALTAEVMVGFAVGLGTIAMARAAEPSEATGRATGWRAAMPTLASIGLVLMVGFLLTGLFGSEAQAMLVLVSDLFVFLLTAFLLPFVMILAPLLEWLLLAIHAPDLVLALQDFVRQLEMNREAPINPFEEINRWIPWLGPLLAWLWRLLPVLVLLALVWFVSWRRRRAKLVSNEERESLFSWAGLRNDIADLLAGLRRPTNIGGLQAALAALQGDDPDTRIRRSYIHMLIAAEEQAQIRAEPQTPREFLATAQAANLAQPEAIERLTAAYEQARYSPGSATADQADAVA